MMYRDTSVIPLPRDRFGLHLWLQEESLVFLLGHALEVTAGVHLPK